MQGTNGSHKATRHLDMITNRTVGFEVAEGRGADHRLPQADTYRDRLVTNKITLGAHRGVKFEKNYG